MGKREAEAEPEADPAYLAAGSGLGYSAPLAYSGYAASPLISGRIWKREAEAEPKADPAYLAAGYGYGLGLGYAGLGYAGLGYSAPLAYSGYAASPLISGRIWKREAEAEPKADPAYL